MWKSYTYIIIMMTISWRTCKCNNNVNENVDLFVEKSLKIIADLREAIDKSNLAVEQFLSQSRLMDRVSDQQEKYIEELESQLSQKDIWDTDLNVQELSRANFNLVSPLKFHRRNRKNVISKRENAPGDFPSYYISESYPNKRRYQSERIKVNSSGASLYPIVQTSTNVHNIASNEMRRSTSTIRDIHEVKSVEPNISVALSKIYTEYSSTVASLSDVEAFLHEPKRKATKSKISVGTNELPSSSTKGTLLRGNKERILWRFLFGIPGPNRRYTTSLQTPSPLATLPFSEDPRDALMTVQGFVDRVHIPVHQKPLMTPSTEMYQPLLYQGVPQSFGNLQKPFLTLPSDQTTIAYIPMFQDTNIGQTTNVQVPMLQDAHNVLLSQYGMYLQNMMNPVAPIPVSNTSVNSLEKLPQYWWRNVGVVNTQPGLTQNKSISYESTEKMSFITPTWLPVVVAFSQDDWWKKSSQVGSTSTTVAEALPDMKSVPPMPSIALPTRLSWWKQAIGFRGNESETEGSNTNEEYKTENRTASGNYWWRQAFLYKPNIQTEVTSSTIGTSTTTESNSNATSVTPKTNENNSNLRRHFEQIPVHQEWWLQTESNPNFPEKRFEPVQKITPPGMPTSLESEMQSFWWRSTSLGKAKQLSPMNSGTKSWKVSDGSLIKESITIRNKKKPTRPQTKTIKTIYKSTPINYNFLHTAHRAKQVLRVTTPVMATSFPAKIIYKVQHESKKSNLARKSKVQTHTVKSKYSIYKEGDTVIVECQRKKDVNPTNSGLTKSRNKVSLKPHKAKNCENFEHTRMEGLEEAKNKQSNSGNLKEAEKVATRIQEEYKMTGSDRKEVSKQNKTRKPQKAKSAKSRLRENKKSTETENLDKSKQTKTKSREGTKKSITGSSQEIKQMQTRLRGEIKQTKSGIKENEDRTKTTGNVHLQQNKTDYPYQTKTRGQDEAMLTGIESREDIEQTKALITQEEAKQTPTKCRMEPEEDERETPSREESNPTWCPGEEAKEIKSKVLEDEIKPNRQGSREVTTNSKIVKLVNLVSSMRLPMYMSQKRSKLFIKKTR